MNKNLKKHIQKILDWSTIYQCNRCGCYKDCAVYAITDPDHRKRIKKILAENGFDLIRFANVYYRYDDASIYEARRMQECIRIRTVHNVMNKIMERGKLRID